MLNRIPTQTLDAGNFAGASELLFPIVSKSESEHSGGSFSVSNYYVHMMRISSDGLKELFPQRCLGQYKDVHVYLTDQLVIIAKKTDDSHERIVCSLNFNQRDIFQLERAPYRERRLPSFAENATESKIGDARIDYAKSNSILELLFYV